ncbi:GerAB/ArcD/ProY family transporter [Alkalihalophilus pseudofirmus]|uniref:GerAB/ArcD/ProY family transporter n=1 Tax=Alkalihalophilus pseudofirmus TaxID=79885 RepID=A0AAJ2NJY9_ALKPS|nr:GerAB/ArcD/ProY family transporter [Alkalihalophilus pseudofirmus]MDV2883641.1 GerAB/ArcD/ProY family transporter [Alkalihalophilus pseudofirmus]WEG17770.1 GerAB/ArcD/ProY family transporter [Alkalihalophilus pseudofirmus]
MKHTISYSISPGEMCLTLVSMIIGVGILTLPRVLATELGLADGWISILLASGIIMSLVALYVKLQQQFPGETLLQYIAGGKVGKWFAPVLALLFLVYFLCLMGYEVRILTSLMRMYILDQTPSEVIAALMLFITTYAVSKGVQGIVHLSLMFLPIVVFVLLGLISFTSINSDMTNLLPVMPEGIFPILLTMKVTLFSFLGLEILFFLMGYMKKSDLKVFPLMAGIMLIMFLYLLVTIISYANFSVDTTTQITFPTVELAKQIEIPGGFFERLESLLITVWIMTIFNTISISQLIFIQLLEKHFVKKEAFTTYLPAISIFFIFIVAFIPHSITETFQFGEWIGWLGLALYLVSLGCGYLFFFSRRRKTGKVGKGVSYES